MKIYYCAGCGRSLQENKALSSKLSYHDKCAPKVEEEEPVPSVCENRVTSQLKSLGSMLDQINHPPFRLIKNDRH